MCHCCDLLFLPDCLPECCPPNSAGPSVENAEELAAEVALAAALWWARPDSPVVDAVTELVLRARLDRALDSDTSPVLDDKMSGP